MIQLRPKLDDVFPPDAVAVFLHAHADDESFLSAGIIAALREAGREVVVVYAATALVEGFERTAVRQAEAEAARAVLGNYEVRYLPFCEPKYTGASARRLVDQSAEDVAKSIEAVAAAALGGRPRVLVSYDENGGYGNRDHIVLHRAGRALLRSESFRTDGFLEVTLSRDSISNWIDEASLRLPESDIPKLSYWSEEFGLEDSEIDLKFELGQNLLLRKRRALAAHVSQMKEGEFPLSLSGEDFRQVFGVEYFKRLK